MFGSFLKTKVESTFDAKKILSQLNYATAVALTKTAKDAQAQVLKELPNNFTLRGNWFNPSNKFGVKIKAATKQSLEAQVSTAASWLTEHELGREKFPFRNFLAVPTTNVRRNKKQIIQRMQRPRNLKNSYVIATKSGNSLLLQKKGRGKNKQNVVMYVLIPKAKIKKQSTFYAPVEQTIRKNLAKNFHESMEKALKTAR